MSDRRPTGALERAVLEHLWRSPEGATPREVREALGTDLAYTTIMTILARLWRKGVVERRPEGRAFRYRALTGEAEWAARQMRDAFEPVNDRSLALSRFVDGLSARDEAALRRILDELEQ